MAAANTKNGLNPSDHQRIFGATFCKHEHASLIAFGSGRHARSFSRWELGRLGVPHSAAAVHLNKAIQSLDIHSPADLAANAHALGQFKGLGVTCYAVLMAVLHACGYDVEEVHETDVSYATMKRRATLESSHPKRRTRREKDAP